MATGAGMAAEAAGRGGAGQGGAGRATGAGMAAEAALWGGVGAAARAGMAAEAAGRGGASGHERVQVRRQGRQTRRQGGQRGLGGRCDGFRSGLGRVESAGHGQLAR
ncbi:hypothetical protein GCM10010168_40000 [Actinoplanes ianthinogenes]|uniref:Uncharacterized protein n=1 Tax=Actinoplanes ianthinogenes TaxID=122358 RepID=A0ABN6CH97_9ACTN|nr:hypothetical protein Aiant_43480 [Actinoplanes ianthinogenes]GGR18310.1 hypothetical protein GCM10010168_40000 [Actinoplanes ianthinogenes]